MRIISLAYILALECYVFFGVYIFFLYRKTKLKNKPQILFIILCAAFALWSFGYIFLVSAASREECWFWFKFSLPGFCLFPAILLHFFHSFTGKEHILKKFKIPAGLYSIIYLPGIVFIIKGFIGIFTIQDFVLKSYGWEGVHTTSSIWYVSYLIYYIFYISSCIIMTILWKNKTKSHREKKQADIIVAAAIVTFFINIIIESILPLLNINIIPRIAQIVTLIWFLGIWYSMVKYKLMILTPKIAADEIMSKILDILILTDPDGKILKVNRQLLILTGFDEKELLGETLSAIFEEWELFKNEFEKMRNNRFPENYLSLHLKTKTEAPILTGVSGSAIRDNSDGIIGIVLVAFDKRPTMMLENEIIKRKFAESEMQSLNKGLEEIVDERTRELKMVNEKLRSEMDERKKVSEQLFNAFTRIKSIFDASPDAIIVTDLEGNIQDCNEELLKMNKADSKNELIGKSVSNFIAEKDKIIVKTIIREVLHKGMVKKLKISLLTIFGEEVPAQISSSLIKDYWGKAMGFVTVINNLSDTQSLKGGV